MRPARREFITSLSWFEAPVDDTALPTPRQLARVWFETLYELGIYATP